MFNSKFSYLVEPLRERLYNYEAEIDSFKKSSGVKIVGYVDEILPLEITATFNVYQLKVPSLLYGYDKNSDILQNVSCNLYDEFIFYGDDSSNNGISYFKRYNKYGEELSVEIHNRVDGFLKDAFDVDTKDIYLPNLQDATRYYDRLRRAVRGILAMRQANPMLLSHSDLSIIFELSAVLPPQLVVDDIEKILEHLRQNQISYNEERYIGVIHTLYLRQDDVIDKMEEMGLQIIEDDSTNGRRFFDSSFNHNSPHLYYEILDAYSYKIFSPGIRVAEERYELFYKMMKSHSVEFVVFQKSDGDALDSEREFLIRKLKRDGVDTVTFDGENLNELRWYIEKMGIVV